MEIIGLPLHLGLLIHSASIMEMGCGLLEAIYTEIILFTIQSMEITGMPQVQTQLEIRQELLYTP